MDHDFAIDDPESKFEAIFNHNSEAMGISCRGMFCLCNQSFLTTFGYSSQDELIGKPVLDVIAPECHSEVKEYIAKRSRNEAIPTYFDFIGIRKDGQKFDFEISSSNYTLNGEVYSIVIGRDITERKKLRKELEESEEIFKIAFRSNPSIVGISALENGSYIEVNEQFLKTLGWKREEVIGYTSKDLHIFKDYTQRSSLLKQINEKGCIRNFEMDLQTKLGSTLSVEFNADLIVYQNQLCLLAQVSDISDRKMAETALKRINEDLESRVRKRTKDLEDSIHELEAFSYSISHDFKAPLRAIHGFSQICVEEGQGTLSETCKNYLNRIKESSLYMNQLIDDLQSLYQVKNTIVKHEPIDISGMVLEIIETLKSKNPEREVEVIVEDNVWIQADKNLMRNVMVNLLDNAWKFTAPHRFGTIEFGTTNQSGEKVYFVSDNGVGFNMEFASKLFGTFQKLHGSFEYPGTGIGLAIIQRIIHLHKGKVWAQSDIEKGATFFFTIPEPGL